ncbi:MAG: lipopolysaccharide biosynthesis protein [Microbacteriaceae bacterium]|nr:lipopolysaccharide biosynthesis protein [Microbacteriaceae bacterium]
MSLIDSQSGRSAVGAIGAVTARGARWMFMGQSVKVLTQMVGLVVLSRFLSPAEFGYVAIATTVVGLGEVLRDAGLSSAAIRSSTLTAAQRDILFWISVAFGLILMILVSVFSSVIAASFGVPQLQGILPFLSSVFFLGGITSQYRANLNRQMRFAVMAGIDAISPVLGLAVAIAGAIGGLTYWALVLQLMVTSVVTMVLTIWAGGWCPRRPQRSSGVWPIVKFGGQMTISQALTYAGNNFDTVALGLYSSPYSVGIYTRSFQLVMSPLNQLKSPATAVAIPALSLLRDDSRKFEGYVLRGQAVIGYLIAPIGALLVGASVPIVNISLGLEWSGASPVVALLAAAGTMQQLSGVANWIFVAKGNGKALTNFSLVSLCLKTLCVISLVWFGPIGVAAGYALAVCLAWPIALTWATKSANIYSGPLLTQAIRLLSVALIAAGGSFAIVQMTAALGNLLSLAAAVVSVIAVYAGAIAVPPVRRDLKLVSKTIRMALSRS